MTEKHGTEIQWTHGSGYRGETWNPVIGCSKVSPGCAHCYAEVLTMRFADSWGVPGLPWTPENAEQNVILKPERLDQPLKWTKPRMIFVNSMSDLFHELVPDNYIAEVFAIMSRAPQHVFQVLTKRPERARELLTDEVFPFREHVSYHREGIEPELGGFDWPKLDWPLPNVWLGTSIENCRFVTRADVLCDTPAAVRFISAEPLLGPLVNLDAYVEKTRSVGVSRPDLQPTIGPDLDLTGIDWLIVGGESGPGHRTMKEDWVLDLLEATRCELCEDGVYRPTRPSADGNGRERIDQPCLTCEGTGADTAFFFKQWGGRTPKAGGRLLDGREWNEMPTLSAKEVAA